METAANYEERINWLWTFKSFFLLLSFFFFFDLWLIELKCNIEKLISLEREVSEVSKKQSKLTKWSDENSFRNSFHLFHYVIHRKQLKALKSEWNHQYVVKAVETIKITFLKLLFFVFVSRTNTSVGDEFSDFLIQHFLITRICVKHG